MFGAQIISLDCKQFYLLIHLPIPYVMTLKRCLIALNSPFLLFPFQFLNLFKANVIRYHHAQFHSTNALVQTLLHVGWLHFF